MKGLGVGLLLALSLTEAFASGEFSKSQGQPWPLPHVYVTESEYSYLDKDLKFVSNLDSCDIISQAFQRYKSYITQTECARAKKVHAHHARENRVLGEPKLSVNLYIAGTCEKWPTWTSNEQYAIFVNFPPYSGQVHIEADTVWGALRALETFSQLVYDTGDGFLLVNNTLVVDFPRFPYRGVLLDTSRHYLPMRVLLENLETMAQNKMNVFHWHIVDDQSFPYVSTVFPNLSNLGAYDPAHIYTPKDVAQVIEFARVRGIRVIPEFDSPGHTLSWGPGEPGFLTPCYSQGRSDGTFGPVNPILNSTYTFLSKFFAEVTSVFPDQYVHLGGDEVSFKCWQSNPDILKFMQDKGMGKNFSLLEQYYEQKVLNIVRDLKKNVIVWQELFDNHVDLEKDTLIQVWMDGYQNELAAVTKAGYKTILSSPWYLDYISYGVDWHKYYTVSPLDFDGTDFQKSLVMGGTACMWGEHMDANNVMGSVWPRASAVAERLWSDPSVKDPDAAAPRLEEHRCRMMKRGLTVNPINGPSYCTCDIYN